MFATLIELFKVLSSNQVTLFFIILSYFWILWLGKVIFSWRYKPVVNNFNAKASVIIPTYKEDRDILSMVIGKVLNYPSNLVSEVIIVTDIREKGIVDWLRHEFSWDPRVKIIKSDPGKRTALARGIEATKEDFIVVVESDTMVNSETIPELIKPFADESVGGVVGDQRIYKPYDSIWSFFNMVSEKIKYKLTIPALSYFNQVTVLGGRCVAYRRKAILPNLSKMENEFFINTRCISGDDGRFTSLLLEDGWKTNYQSTSVVETVSPQSMSGLIKQRLRWFRNSARRTSRALVWDGWIWRKKAALVQMISTWIGTILMFTLLFLLISGIMSTNWFWYGMDPLGIIIRLGLLSLGLLLTRFIRILPVFGRNMNRKWIWILGYPWYLFLMFWVRVYSIPTMNVQGWISRKFSGPGGFKP